MASDPESVCYIEKHDGEGYKVEEIDGDYCHLCATEKAKDGTMMTFELSRQTGLRRKPKGKRKRPRISRIERIK